MAANNQQRIESFIFVIEANNRQTGNSEYYIGFSMRPQQRLQELRRAYNTLELRLVETPAFGATDDRDAVRRGTIIRNLVHNHLAQYRIRGMKGYWFKLDDLPEAVDFIKTSCLEHGLPQAPVPQVVPLGPQEPDDEVDELMHNIRELGFGNNE